MVKQGNDLLLTSFPLFANLTLHRCVPNPAEVIPLSEQNVKVSAVFAGLRHSLFLSREGHLYGCGDNTFAQVGIGKIHEHDCTLGTYW
jgi:hypothetical protein